MSNVKLGAKLNTSYDLEAVKVILNSHQATEIDFVEGVNWIWFHVDTSLSESIMDELEASDHVCLVERCVPKTTCGIKIPNDPFYAKYQSRQYDEMQVLQGWRITQGSQSVNVGVVDTGADLTHPDLVDNINVGYNVVTNAPTGAAGTGSSTTSGHGTMVAGGIVAKSNNNRGVTGVAPGCRLTPIRANKIDDPQHFDTSAIQQGIIKAADLGCKIINISIGGKLGPTPVTPVSSTSCDIGWYTTSLNNTSVLWHNSTSYAKGRITSSTHPTGSTTRVNINWVEGEPPSSFSTLYLLSQAEQDAIDYAWNSGATIFVAAGNDYGWFVSSPCASINAIAVAASDTDALAGFSNRGPWVDFCADYDAYTTYPFYVYGEAINEVIKIPLKGKVTNGSNVITNITRATGSYYRADTPTNEGMLVIGPWSQPNCVVSTGPDWFYLQYPANQTDTVFFDAYSGAGYNTGGGTSFASPTAAGLGALLLSANPSLTNAQIRNIIKSTATPLEGEEPYAFGTGKINFYKALLQAVKIFTYASPQEGTYDGPTIVSLNIDNTTDVTYPITTWYTTDGTNPVSSGTRKKYTDPINIVGSSTLKYYSVDSSGTPIQEDIRVDTYTINPVNCYLPITENFTITSHLNGIPPIIAGLGAQYSIDTFTVHTVISDQTKIDGTTARSDTFNIEETYLGLFIQKPNVVVSSIMAANCPMSNLYLDARLDVPIIYSGSVDCTAGIDSFYISQSGTYPTVAGSRNSSVNIPSFVVIAYNSSPYTTGISNAIAAVAEFGISEQSSYPTAFGINSSKCSVSQFNLNAYEYPVNVNSVQNAICKLVTGFNVDKKIEEPLITGVNSEFAFIPAFKFTAYIYPPTYTTDYVASMRIRAPNGMSYNLNDTHGKQLALKTKTSTGWQ